MNYSPNQDLKKTYFLSLCFMAPGIVTFMLAPFSPIQAVIQALSLLLCSISLFIMYRFALTTFGFIIEDGELTVQKVAGKRITAVARLALSECNGLVKIGKDTLKGRKFSGGKYTYTVNYAPACTYLLTFRDLEREIALILECDESFAAAISALLPHNAEIKL